MALTEADERLIRLVAKQAACEAVKEANKERDKDIVNAITLHQATCSTATAVEAAGNQRKGRASLWQWLVTIASLGAVIASTVAALK